MSIPNGVVELRKAIERETQRAIAKRLGISESYLSLMANKGRKPGLALALRLRDELGISVDDWDVGVRSTRPVRATKKKRSRLADALQRKSL